MYNSPEERAMIQALSGNQEVPGVVVGIGSDVPQHPQPGRFRQKFGHPRAICHLRRANRREQGLPGAVRLLPDLRPRHVRPAVARADRQLRCCRFPSIRASVTSDSLTTPTSSTRWRRPICSIMPSYFESLSMVALEAWALGKPVLANGKCDVLEGSMHPQQRRAVLRRSVGVRRDAERDRAKPLAQRQPWPQRPAVLPRALRLAGDRTEISRDARAALRRARPREPSHRCRDGSIDESRNARRARQSSPRFRPGPVVRLEPSPPRPRPPTPPPPPAAGGASPSDRGRPSAPSHQHLAAVTAWRRLIPDWAGVVPSRAPAGGSPGARDARVWRRHRPRSARHPARAAAGRLRVRHLRRDRRSDASNRSRATIASSSTPAIPTTCCCTIFRLDRRRRARLTRFPDRMALIYHNITPPEYFVGVHRTLARQCFRGRRELHAYVDRCDLALGDSEFNRQDLDALGFPRTDVLPVVPDFSHLDVAAESLHRRPVRRRLDQRRVRRPGHRQQEDRRSHPLLPRLPGDSSTRAPAC